MRSVVIAIILLAGLAPPAFGCGKDSKTSKSAESTESMRARTVFNRMSGDTLQIDMALKAAYGCKYIFADVLGDSSMQKAKPIAGGLPGPTAGPDGRPLIGKVVVGYIVTVEGVAADPVVLESSDPRLRQAALEVMTHWRFNPATFNGKPVATLAVQEFMWGPQPHA